MSDPAGGCSGKFDVKFSYEIDWKGLWEEPSTRWRLRTDRTQARLEESQDPLRRGSREEAETELENAGLDAMERLRNGSHRVALEREAQR